jgi:Secretion system C-terminal sorting domain
MKTRIIILILFISIFSVAFSQQKVQTENDWSFNGGLFSSVDTIQTKFSRGSGGYTLGFYGKTILSGGEQGIQMDFLKILNNLLLIPDTVSLECQVEKKTGNIKGTDVHLGVMDSSGAWYYKAEENNIVPLDLSQKRITWDMSWAKTYGIKKISRIVLSPQGVTTDSNSTFIGVTMGVRNLTFIYDTLGKRVIDFDTTGGTGVSESQVQIPRGFVLEQNYPNPFNPSTTIRFTVPEREQVSLTVFNLLGQEVKNLFNEEKQKGSYEVSFNASNLPSGIYFYKLQSGNFVETRKMLLMK